MVGCVQTHSDLNGQATWTCPSAKGDEKSQRLFCQEKIFGPKSPKGMEQRKERGGQNAAKTNHCPAVIVCMVGHLTQWVAPCPLRASTCRTVSKCLGIVTDLHSTKWKRGARSSPRRNPCERHQTERGNRPSERGWLDWHRPNPSGNFGEGFLDKPW